MSHAMWNKQVWFLAIGAAFNYLASPVTKSQNSSVTYLQPNVMNIEIYFNI